MTTSTVSSSAVTGSLGGSILGALITALLGWFFNNFGEMILKFILGTLYTQMQTKIKAWYDKRKKAANSAAGVIDDVEKGTQGHELPAAAMIVNATPGEPATMSGVFGASNQTSETVKVRSIEVPLRTFASCPNLHR